MKPENVFNWRPSLYACVAVCIILAAIAVCPHNELGAMLYVLIAAPVASLVVLVVAFRKTQRQNRLSFLSMLAVTWAVSAVLLMHFQWLRSSGRWLLWSNQYKSAILAQPIPANGKLKHAEWDGWGGFGAGDTTEYLVFDPANSLSGVAPGNASGKHQGLPCEVASIRRLESKWYEVLFYTDTDWEHCS